MRLLLCVATVLITNLLNVSPALSHARWFVAPEEVIEVAYQWDALYGWMIAGAILFSTLIFAIDIFGYSSKRRQYFIHDSIGSLTGSGWLVVASLLGLTLILNGMTGVIIAPDLTVNDPFVAQAFCFAQIILGAMLLLKTRAIIAAAIIAFLPVIAFFIWPFNQVINYVFEFAGVGAALVLIAPSLSKHDQKLYERLSWLIPQSLNARFRTVDGFYKFEWNRRPDRDGLSEIEKRERREKLAHNIIRTALGLQLIVLAVNNKLFNPGLSLAFVEKNAFINFMPLLGVSEFTNLHFVFAAGIAELTFGLLVAGNVATRATSAVVMVAFIIPAFLFGAEEIFGHLPILAILALFIICGSGSVVFRTITTDLKKAPSPEGKAYSGAQLK